MNKNKIIILLETQCKQKFFKNKKKIEYSLWIKRYFSLNMNLILLYLHC